MPRVGCPRADFLDAQHTVHSIRYNARSNMFVEWCACHSRCRHSKVASAGKKAGSGRPLGHLMAWLLEGHDASGREGHIQCAPPSLERRKEGRRRLMQLEGAAGLLSQEVAGDGEPETVE